MCLILLAYDIHPDFTLILAANRDEYYRRPTASLDYWKDDNNILAGRDLEALGTWLGITRKGRWAALTNFRGASPAMPGAPSRGDLVAGFLVGVETPASYLRRVETGGRQYNGFNLLAGNPQNLYYYTNQGSGHHRLTPGVYGVSTCLMGTKWPKIDKGTAGLTDCITGKRNLDIEVLFSVLEDRSFPTDEDLPQTGLDRNWERTLSPLFIESDAYGTRSSSIILMSKAGEVTFAERTFVKGDGGEREKETRRFDFSIA